MKRFRQSFVFIIIRCRLAGEQRQHTSSYLTALFPAAFKDSHALDYAMSSHDKTSYYNHYILLSKYNHTLSIIHFDIALKFRLHTAIGESIYCKRSQTVWRFFPQSQLSKQFSINWCQLEATACRIKGTINGTHTITYSGRKWGTANATEHCHSCSAKYYKFLQVKYLLCQGQTPNTQECNWPHFLQLLQVDMHSTIDSNNGGGGYTNTNEGCF